MNSGRLILTGIILSIVYLVMEFATHGYLLRDIYMQTASIWRPQAEMEHLIWMMWLAEVIFAFAIALMYAAGFDAKKPALSQGFRFGVLLTLLIAPFTGLGWYVILPIPGILAVYWFLAAAVQMMVMGIVAGIVYRA